MYIKINTLNPRDISFSENFPNPVGAIVLRVEDNQVWRYSNGDWIEEYQSKSMITSYYRMCELMTQVMAMHAENLQRESEGSSPAYVENDFADLCEQMNIIAASRQ